MSSNNKYYCWVITLSSFFINFNSWGFNASFTIFLTYFLNKPNATLTKLDLSFITGIAFGLGQLLSPLVLWALANMKTRKKYNIVILIGSVLLSLSYIVPSFNIQNKALAYIFLGCVQGFGIGLVYIPSSVLIPAWFDGKNIDNLGIATGISMCGTGAGGVVYALVSNKLIQWDVLMTLRILGTVSGVCCAIVGLFCREPEIESSANDTEIQSFKSLEKEKEKEKENDKRLVIFEKSLLKKEIICVIVFIMISNFANSILLFSLTPFATNYLHMTNSQASLASILTNIGSIIGRPLFGKLSDFYGIFNLTILYSMISTILVFAFWLVSSDKISFYILCFFFGNFISCAGVSPNPISISIISHSNAVNFNTIYSASWFLTGIVSIFSVPLIMYLDKPFNQIFIGSLFSIDAIVLLIAREVKIKSVEKYKIVSTSEEHNVETPGTLYEENIIIPPGPIEHLTLEGVTPVHEGSVDYFSFKPTENHQTSDDKQADPNDRNVRVRKYFKRMFKPKCV